MNTKKILAVGGVAALALAGVVGFSGEDLPPQAELGVAVKDRVNVENLRVKNSVEKKAGKTKNYNAIEKKLTIEGTNRRIELKLDSPYVVSGLIASDDCKVAEMTLVDFENTNLFDDVRFFDVNNNYEEVEKTLRFKYGIKKEKCNEGECYDYTEWVEFQILEELPNKNIRIGIFTETKVREKIEWIPTVEGFEILEWAAWDVSTAVWVREFYVGDKETIPQGVAFNSDGTKMYVIGNGSNDVHEYHLSTGFDVSTASWDSEFYVGAKETNPLGVAFNSDGTKMYVAGYTGKDITEYHLTTGFDISTATWDSEFYVGDKETAPQGVAFNSDGTKMYVIGNGSNDVHEYHCTAFDVSTCSWDSEFYVGAKETLPRSVAFNSDGTKMYVIGTDSNDVHEYHLSTGFDVSTASWDSEFYVGAKETNPLGVAFNSDGTKMYVAGSVSDDVHEYSLPAVSTYTPAVVIIE